MRTRNLLRFAPALLPLLAPLSCGPEAPVPNAGNVKPAASAKPSATVQEVALTPVEAPEGLAVTAHFKSPRAASAAVLQLVPEANDFKLDALLHEMASDDALASLLDVDQPVDVAFVERPRVNNPNAYDDGQYVGFAIGIRDDADFGALTGKFKLVGGADGVQYVVREGKEGQWFHACAVAAAMGPSKRRLVCGDDHERRHLDILLPWLVRGAPNHVGADDVRVELFASAYKKKYANDLRDGRDDAASGVAGGIKTDHAEVDRVLRRAAKAVVAESFGLVDDFDRGGLSVNFGPLGPEVKVDATFASATSWLTKALLAGGDVTTPVPALFGKLPIDRAGFAGFMRATPQHDALMQPLQTFAGELVEAAAADFKWAKGDKELALATVRLMFPKAADSVVVYGRGDDKPAVAGAKAKAAPAKAKGDKAPHDDESKLEQMREGLARPTWSLSAIDRPLDQSIELSKSWSAFAAKPTIPGVIKQLSKDAVDFKVTPKAMPAKELKDLPKGSFGQTYDVTATVFVVKDKKRGKERGKVHFVVQELIVPDGQHVWSAIGNNLAQGELSRRVLDGIAGKGTTASSLPGFAAFTAGTPSFGMMIRLGEFVREVLPPKGTQQAEEVLGQLPDKGNSVLSIRSSATRAGAGGTAQVVMLLPRDLFAGFSLWSKLEKSY
jgi:hypothetical protein